MEEITNYQANPMMIIEGLKIDRVQDSMNKIQQFQKVVQGALSEGHDYGAAFSGSSKPSLLKPGAEKILMLLGLSSVYQIMEQVQDYEDGFFAYTIKCLLIRNGVVVTEGLGHCNSKEKKYDSDKQDKYMLGNTCLKMAKKRAQVDAALTVGSLSNIFTQDLEDMAQFSQSEQMDNMTAKDAKSIKLTFGKNKGKTLGEVLQTDRSYIEWLSEKAKDAVMRKACFELLNAKDSASETATTKETKVSESNKTKKAEPEQTQQEQTEYEMDPADEDGLPWN